MSSQADNAAKTPEEKLLRLGGMVRSTHPVLADWTREVETQLAYLRKMLLAEAEAATRDADALADLACDRETISGG